MEDRIVYSIAIAPKPKRRRQITHEGFKGQDGRWHRYLNCAVPIIHRATIDDSICEHCGHGYSHVLVEHKRICEECRLEVVAEASIAFQVELGIDLGWRMIEEYTQSEQAMSISYRPGQLSRIGHHTRQGSRNEKQRRRVA